MFNFVVQIALMASLAVIVYMLARALPRVAEESFDSEPQNSFDRFVKRIPLEKLDVAIHHFFIKLLRKIRLLVSKFDNLLNEYITGLRENSLAQNQQDAMKEKMEILISSTAKEKEDSQKEHQEEEI